MREASLKMEVQSAKYLKVSFACYNSSTFFEIGVNLGCKKNSSNITIEPFGEIVKFHYCQNGNLAQQTNIVIRSNISSTCEYKWIPARGVALV